MRMKRLVGSTLLLMGLAASAQAEVSGRASLGLGIDIGNAPPPPVVVYREEPRVTLIPSSTVYVVSDNRADYDIFRYGVNWYIYNDGYWYRSRNHRGPFRVVEVRYVPRAILTVPARHWKHHPHGGPPGQMKKRDGAVVNYDRHDNGKGKGKGRR